MMNPEPSEATRVPGAPGAAFSPRNSRNTSSSVRPGEFCGVSCAGGAARAVAWVDTLTTLPTSRAVNCAKRSAKGVSAAAAAAARRAADASGCGAGGAPRRCRVQAAAAAPGAAGLSCDGAAPCGARRDRAGLRQCRRCYDREQCPRSRDRSASSAEGLHDILLFPGKPGILRRDGRITRPERRALQPSLKSGDSPQRRAERIGALAFPFRSI